MLEEGKEFYQWMLDMGDPRVESWFLMATPLPILWIYLGYLSMVFAGPRLMKPYQAFSLRPIIIAYNFALVLLSLYMFEEFLVTSVSAGYSYVCQPVDYSNSPLAIRMANVCWWYFFSKIIEMADTAFFIMRKKNGQVSFLHCYHHCTMISNWWLGVKYIAGGQSWFLAMLNCAVHVLMYTYYMLAAIGVDQRYLWWKRYLTRIQLTQFVAVIIHTTINIMADCSYPKAFNYAVVLYALSLIVLFSNFYIKAYVNKKASHKTIEPEQNGHTATNDSHLTNGVQKRKRLRIDQ